jgi:integrase
MQATFSGKERVGRITIERFRDSVRLRWTLNQKTYTLTIGKEDKDTIKAARAKAQLINSDITFDRFDSSLVKYGKQLNSVALELVSDTSSLSLRELWDRYWKDKATGCKPSYLHHVDSTYTPKIYKCPIDDISKAIAIKNWLLSITTRGITKRILIDLNACCKWGIKHKLVNFNVSPYEGMSQELGKFNWEIEPSPNAFNQTEKEQILNAFENSEHYSYYFPLVKFWLLTGCRPSEGIGVTWGQISHDAGEIIFDRASVYVAGRIIEVKGSKNARHKKHRTFPCSESLRHLLISIRPTSYKPYQLVFPSPRLGKTINYNNFSRRAWDGVVNGLIERETTPYSCRDTFITEQINKGVPIAIVAYWVDNSVDVIQKRYFDTKITAIRPID